MPIKPKGRVISESAEKLCAAPGCGKPAGGDGRKWCWGHQARYRRGERGAEFLRPFRRQSAIDVSKQIARDPKDADLKRKIHEILRKSKSHVSIDVLSDRLDAGISRVKAAIAELRAEGKNILVREASAELASGLPIGGKPTRIDIASLRGKPYKFGAISDQHLCSKYSRLDVLNALFRIFEAEGVDTVYQMGNILDGEAEFNKFDLLVPPGVESQVRYLIDNWPRSKGITTKFITGDDHEGWWTRGIGIDIGKKIQHDMEAAGRKDLLYLGHMEHDIEFVAPNGRSMMRLAHPGGGTAYATSYQPARTIESLQGGEKPAIILFGHWHKFEVGYPREVWAVQVGSTQDQNPWLRKRRIQSHVGGCIISFELTDDGTIQNFCPHFFPFFDRDFYDRGWKYKWAI